MSDQNTQNPQAGWYPDPAGSAQQRWWDGNGWTGTLRDAPGSTPAERPRYGEHAPVVPPQAPGAAPSGQASQYGDASAQPAGQQQYAPNGAGQNSYGYAPAAQRDTSIETSTPFIWIDVLLPLLSLLSLAIVPIDALVQAMALGTGDPSTMVLPPEYVTASVVNWLLALAIYIAHVVLGFLDWRALKKRGVQRPFHWAWSFLVAPWVYVIGRSVVVKRVTGGGLLPLWVFLGVFVLQCIVVIGWSVAVASQLSQTMPGLT